MIRNRVVLPAPLRPTSAMRSGPRIEISMPSPNNARPPRAIRIPLPTNRLRPAGTSVSGRSSTIDGSSRSVRSALSRRVLASSTRAALTPSMRPADSCALRFIAPTMIFGSPASFTLRAAVLDRRAARSRACCICRFSRLTCCSALRTLLSATRCPSRTASSYAVKSPPNKFISPRCSSAMRSIRSRSMRSWLTSSSEPL